MLRKSRNMSGLQGSENVSDTIRLTFEHVRRASSWAFDLYAGQIVIWWRKRWHWAELAENVVAVGPHGWPNGRREYFLRGEDLTSRGKSEAYAIEHGWLTVGEPLDELHAAKTLSVRFGRVGRVKGQVLLDPPIDFGDADDISPPGWKEAWEETRAPMRMPDPIS